MSAFPFALPVRRSRATLAWCVLPTLLVGPWGCDGRAPRTDASAPLAPDTVGLGAVDSLVRAGIERGQFPGAVVWVSRSDRTVLERAYGQAEAFGYGGGQYGRFEGSPAGGVPEATGLVRLARPRPMTTQTVFDLASVTKVLATTMAAMLLVDRGVLDVDERVTAYLQDFRGGGRDSVRIRDLLTHRSGLPQWTPVYYHATDAQSAWEHVRTRPLPWVPGTGRHYSDLGFLTMGRVVETLTGKSLDAFLADALYRPMGLVHTGFRRRLPSDDPSDTPDRRGGSFAATSHGNPYEYRMVHDSTFGYRIPGDADAWNGWRRRTLAGEVNDGNAFHAFGGVAGHAGLFSTAAEGGALLRLLLGRGRLDGRRWIDEAVVDRFLTTTGEGQALGWLAPEWAPPGSFSHTGFTGTWVLGVPELDLAVVLLTNRQHFGVDDDTRYPDLSELQRAVAEALIGGQPSTSR